MKSFLPEIIGPYQSSFLKGRRPADNTIIIQELMNKFKTTKAATGNFMLKLDLKKAFDKLEWSFIYWDLFYFKFP